MNPMAFVMQSKRSRIGAALAVIAFMIAAALVGSTIMRAGGNDYGASPAPTSPLSAYRVRAGEKAGCADRPNAGPMTEAQAGSEADGRGLTQAFREKTKSAEPCRRDINAVLAWGRGAKAVQAARAPLAPPAESPASAPETALSATLCLEKKLESSGLAWAGLKGGRAAAGASEDVAKWATADTKRALAEKLPGTPAPGPRPRPAARAGKPAEPAFVGQDARKEAMSRFLAEAEKLRAAGRAHKEGLKRIDSEPGGATPGRSGKDRTGRNRPTPKEAPPKPPPHSVQKIIKNAELHVEVEKFAEAGIKVNTAVARYRGFYADSRITQNEDGTTGGYYVIRVPQENFEALYAELKAVGRIKLENAKGDDVTASFFDLESRIRNAEHMEARLLALLEDKKRHNKLSEILEIERALGEKRREVERLKGQMRLMQDRIQLGTIHLTISEPKRSVPQGSMGVEVADAAAVDRKIDPLVTGLGGQVSGRNCGKRPDGTGVVKALLRVPMTNFGRLVDAVRGMGRVVSEEIKGYNPVAIAADPAAKKVMGTLEIEIFEPPSQKPGGTVNIEVASLSEAAKSIGNILENLKGQLVSRNETRRGATASAHYTVRTPRVRFAELVASLNAVGRVDNKQVMGVDVVRIEGPAAQVPCDLSINLYERARQAPSATATVSTTDVRKATKAVEALLQTVEGHVVSHHEHRTPQGLGSVNYVLRCRRKHFAAMVGGLDSVGRVGSKDVQGLDHEVVTGAAADTLCNLSLVIEERRAPLPGAVLEISAEDAAKASAALKALIDKHGVEPVSVKRTSTLEATLELWKLHVPVKAFDDFVEAVQELGEIKKRQVEGSSAAALEGPDPDALAKVALTLRESRPPLPSARLELVTVDGAATSKQVREMARKVKADIKDHSRSRGATGQPVETWVLRVPVAAFEEFVEDAVEFGEIRKREVEGVSPDAQKTLDPKAMAEVSLTLYEKLAPVPTADITIEVGDVSEASKELRSIRKALKAQVEDRKRLKASDGTAVEHWVLLVPVESFESAVEDIEDLGEVKSRDVNGVGAGALGKRDPKAKARVVVAIGQVSPLLAARKGTFRSTAASAFKTLGYLMAALLWGLIVLVPIFLSLALVLKLVLRIMKPKSGVREVQAAAVTTGDPGAGD